MRAIRGESLFPGLSDRSGTGSSAACTCPSGRLSLRTSSRARIPTTRAHGSYSDAAYAQVDWFRDSVERYLRAYQVDSTCRADPQMLADLLKAAAHPVAGRSAARAIRDIYGVEAIPALEQALEQPPRRS